MPFTISQKFNILKWLAFNLILLYVLTGCASLQKTSSINYITPTTGGTESVPLPAPDILGAPPELSGTIVYHSAGAVGNNNIFTVTFPEGTIKQLTSTNDNIEPSWSPDGKKIVYACLIRDHHEICIMDEDGSNNTQVTDSAANKWGPDWSPDGKYIVYVSNEPQFAHIYVLNLENEEIYRLLSNSPGNESSPRWSPDGNWIAYVSDRDGFNLYKARPDGTEEEKITDYMLDDRPAWSPDGRSIVFRRLSTNSSMFNGNEIWKIDADGKNETSLTDNSSGDDWPSYSPDGRWIVYSHEQQNNEFFLQVIPADGGISSPVLSTPPVGFGGRWKP